MFYCCVAFFTKSVGVIAKMPKSLNPFLSRVPPSPLSVCHFAKSLIIFMASLFLVTSSPLAAALLRYCSAFV